jgi:hypothetical protein
LFVFYSGHADAEALHLAGTRLGLTEIRDLAAGSPADARVLIVDSCRSGALTRVKGGRAVSSFEIDIDAPPPARGLAILSSSAAGEDAQESDQLGASVFTHHLVSALLGAGDRDGDGRVTIGEAFTYAAERTLASTASTLPGPQHPTYRLDIGGRDDLSLTEPGLAVAGVGTLVFPAAGTFLVQDGGSDGTVVAEVTSERGGARLTIRPGRYFVTERNRDFLRQATFTVAAGAVTPVSAGQLRRVDYARFVRKGSRDRDRVVSVLALGGMRGAFLDLGPAWHADLAARLDMRPLSLELRLGTGASSRTNERLGIGSRETAVSVAGLHVFDFDALSVGAGVEVGLAWFRQTFSDPGSHDRDALAGLVAPVVQLDVPMTRAAYARLDGAFVSYFVPTGAAADVSARASYRLSAGAGVYF